MKENGAMLLYFHVRSHPRVLDFTKTVLSVIEKYHKAALEEFGVDGAELPPGRDKVERKKPRPMIILGLVDCECEVDVAQQFGVNANAFPLILFLHKGRPLDRLVGVMTEVQVADAVNAMSDFCNKQEEEQEMLAKQAATTASSDHGPAGGLNKQLEGDEENAGTLLALGIHMMREGKSSKSRQLFEKGIVVAEEKINELKHKHALHKKRLTPETETILRKDANYKAQAHLMMGLALLDHKCGNLDAAYEASLLVREKFPHAAKDQQEVANLMAYIELSYLARYDEKVDDVAKLSMDSKSLDQPCAFYRNQLKLCVAHFTNKHFDLCLDELLRLIRAERKIMPALIEGCIVSDSSKVKGISGITKEEIQRRLNMSP